jgi:hypothetical protein
MQKSAKDFLLSKTNCVRHASLNRILPNRRLGCSSDGISPTSDALLGGERIAIAAIRSADAGRIVERVPA